MPAPVRLQPAMQGGGAKIVALMAAVQAVQDLEAAGKVKITRVAGTSGMGGEAVLGDDLEKYPCPSGYRALAWSGRNREPNQLSRLGSISS